MCYLHKVYSTSSFPVKNIGQSQGSPGHQGVATESGSPCHSCLAAGPPSETASWLCCAFQLPPSLHVDLWIAEFILPDWLICCQSREFSHCCDCWWCSQFALGVFSMVSLLCHFRWSALALQKIRSVSQILLVFKWVQHFSVLILLFVQMHKFLFSIC